MSIRILKKILQDNKQMSTEHFREVLDSAMTEYDIIREVLDREDSGHIIVEKTDYKVVFINRTVTKMVPFCYSAQYASGSSKVFTDYIKDPDVKKYFEKVLSGEEGYSCRDFSFGDADVKTVRISFMPFMSHDRELIDIRFDDITDVLKKEMKLRNTEALASMTTMAAGVAHEIKNPLAAMKIYTSLLRKAVNGDKPKDKERCQEFIDIIEQETERLNEIAVDFLFAVKPIDIHLKMDSINDVLGDILEFVEVEALEKNIEIEKRFDKFLPTLMLDRKLLRRALLNLINNSFFAMKDGKGKLIIETKMDGDSVRVNIADNGCGMSEEQKKRIFEPYFTTKAESGTGLGLTAVLKIMNAHSGEISLESREGTGTVFSLRFPVPQSQRKALGKKEV